jgi:hypothetical protein
MGWISIGFSGPVAPRGTIKDIHVSNPGYPSSGAGIQWLYGLFAQGRAPTPMLATASFIIHYQAGQPSFYFTKTLQRLWHKFCFENSPFWDPLEY